MSVVWLCAQGEGERAGSADDAAQTSDDAGGAQCHSARWSRKRSGYAFRNKE